MIKIRTKNDKKGFGHEVLIGGGHNSVQVPDYCFGDAGYYRILPSSTVGLIPIRRIK